MLKKNQFFILNIFFFFVFFGVLFFSSLNSYAFTSTVEVTRGSALNTSYPYRIITTVSNLIPNDDFPYAFWIDHDYGNDNSQLYVIVPLDKSLQFSCSYYTGNNEYVSVGYETVVSKTYRSSYGDVTMYPATSFWAFQGSNPNTTISVSNYLFNDLDTACYYIVNGTLPEKPFDGTIKLDKFKVYMKGVWNWDLVRPQFNTVVVCPIWSDPDIDDVEISIYAVDPSYRYNTVNYSYDRNMSGQMQQLDISGLTLHGQKFVVRATPFTPSGRGVAIQYEFTFPENFDQPIGQLVIPSDNHYPYSTTIDISGNDVPVEWTVTQTPIYVYETNNIENYYYGDTIAYPVPEITENTENNYYVDYINNYYNTYNEVINNYNVAFDIDISDVSSGDIQQTYDDFGNFFKGFGIFIGKIALLFNGLFPFLSPAVSVILVTMVGIIVVGAVVILFLKVLHVL